MTATRVIFNTTCAGVERKSRCRSMRRALDHEGKPVIGPTGQPELVEDREDLGWFVLLADSFEWRHVGMDAESPFKKGDAIKITMERVTKEV